MGRYARTETSSETDSEENDHLHTNLNSPLNLDESDELSSDSSEDEVGNSDEKIEEDRYQMPCFMSQTIFKVNRGKNRWKNFKRR
jgi:hypothetical protein